MELIDKHLIKNSISGVVLSAATVGCTALAVQHGLSRDIPTCLFAASGALSGALPLGYLASLLSHSTDFGNLDCVKVRASEGEFEPVSQEGNKYALIIVGDGEASFCDCSEIHDNSLPLIQNTLYENGYNPGNVFILDKPDKPGISRPQNTVPCTKRHLRQSVEKLSSLIGPKDKFFLHVMAHGNKARRSPKRSESSFNLYSERVSESELAEVLLDLKPDHSICYFNQCFSGAFARRFGHGRNIAISTSRAEKATLAYVGNELQKKYGPQDSVFSLFFYSAFRGKMPDGAPLLLENRSIEEIFDYASRVQHTTKGARRWAFCKNTPHLFYDRINPKEVTL